LVVAFKCPLLWTFYPLAYIPVTLYKTAMVSELLLFDVGSNKKQNSGREYCSNQTLTIALLGVWHVRRKGRYNEFLRN
jgi:hypothetical protein